MPSDFLKVPFGLLSQSMSSILYVLLLYLHKHFITFCLNLNANRKEIQLWDDKVNTHASWNFAPFRSNNFKFSIIIGSQFYQKLNCNKTKRKRGCTSCFCKGCHLDQFASLTVTAFSGFVILYCTLQDMEHQELSKTTRVQEDLLCENN